MTTSFIIQDTILSRISSSFCKEHLDMTTVPPGTNEGDSPGPATSTLDYVKEGKPQEIIQVTWFLSLSVRLTQFL